ncbi:hypothetical protein VTN00DRAFT_3884 [Thermoascus crustaceus]|uniref:uncharacterized protein n=1 Tax=Thermoascus crustaceus TaxID=5088 RepID=UPI003742E788
MTPVPFSPNPPLRMGWHRSHEQTRRERCESASATCRSTRRLLQYTVQQQEKGQICRMACQPQASVEPVHHAHGLKLTIDVTQRGEGAHQQAPLAPPRAG